MLDRREHRRELSGVRETQGRALGSHRDELNEFRRAWQRARDPPDAPADACAEPLAAGPRRASPGAPEEGRLILRRFLFPVSCSPFPVSMDVWMRSPR